MGASAEKMPFTLTGPPEEAAAQLIAHLERTGVLDASGNVPRSNWDASYAEAQSRLRMSTLSKDCVRTLDYPLPARIVELAISAQADNSRSNQAPAAPLHNAAPRQAEHRLTVVPR